MTFFSINLILKTLIYSLEEKWTQVKIANAKKLKWKFYSLKKEGKYKWFQKITYHFNSFCISRCAVVGLYEALAIVVNGTNCHTQRKHITEVSVAFSSFQLDFWCNIVQIWLSHLRGFTRPRGNGEGILKVKKNNDLLNVCDSTDIIWTMTWASTIWSYKLYKRYE